MLVKLEMHVDPNDLRALIGFALPFGDEAVKSTRTEYDDKEMRGLRALYNSQELWDWFVNDVWGPSEEMEVEEVSAEEAETVKEVENLNEPRLYVPNEAQVAALLAQRDSTVDREMIALAARRSEQEPEEFIEYIPLILTLAKILLAWAKRNK